MTADRAQVDVAALAALLEAATPGPWRHRMDRYDGGRIREHFVACEGRSKPLITGEIRDANAAFIAAARNALPDLLDEVVRLRAQVAAAEASLQWHDDWRYCPRCACGGFLDSPAQALGRHIRAALTPNLGTTDAPMVAHEED